MQAVFSVNVACFALALLCGGDVAAQQIYKCKTSTGKIEFSDAPCQTAHSSEKILVQGNTLDSSGNRELLLRKENEELKEQLRNQQQKAVTSSGGMASQRTQPDFQAERIDTFACEKAKRDYEVTASSTANSQTIVDAKRSVMFGTCGMREPDKNTTTINNRINNTIR